MIDLLTSHWILLLALAVAGAGAGFAAGLFGIGGGAIIVPTLVYLFSFLGYQEWAMHLAVSTSLATICLTSMRSVWSHHQRGVVDWEILRSWGPWISIGAGLGMCIAAFLTRDGLMGTFGVLGIVCAAQLFFGRPDWKIASDMPREPYRAGLGTGVGVLSSLMGIGGGTFGVTLMAICGRPIHQAIGTSAGFGFAIGLPGTLFAIYWGYGQEGLPLGSIGYVNLIAFAFISLFALVMTPVGAAVAHRFDGLILRKLFAVLLAVVATRMLYDVIV